MGIAFDKLTILALGTGDRNFNHIPVGTPRGVIVYVVDGVTTDQVVGVTYGGTTMTEVTGSPQVLAGGEGGAVHAFWLGASIPTGTQSVAINRNDATNYIAACYTITSDNSDTYLHDIKTSSSTSVAAPGATLVITEPSFVSGALYSGSNNPGSTAPSGAANDVTGDYGTDTSAIASHPTVQTSNYAFTWSQTADDGVTIVIAMAQRQKYQFGQAQAAILATSQVYAQAQADILQTYQGYAQANGYIYRIDNGFGQAQGDIKQTYQSYGQAQGEILVSLTTNKAFGQALGLNGVLDNLYTAIDEVVYDDSDYIVGGGGNVVIKLGPLNTPSWPIDHILRIRYQTTSTGAGGTVQLRQGNTIIWQTSGNITSPDWTIFEYRLSSSEIANITNYADLNIRFATDDRFLVSWVEFQVPSGTPTYQVYGQAQATILQTYQAYAQAQAHIIVLDIEAVGQAQAWIEQTYNQSGNAQAWIENTYNQSGNAQAWIEATYNAHANAQGWIEATYNQHGNAQGWIENTYNQSGNTQGTIKATYVACGQAQALIGVRSNQYGQAQATIKAVTSSCGQAQADIKATSIACGNAQGLIKNTYQSYGQAQALISIIRAGHGQAQALILAVTNSSGNAQADIKQTYNQYANAQGHIRITVNTYGQAQAWIEAVTNQFAQAEGYITSGSIGFAQAQALIVRLDINVHGNANALISKSAGYGQAQAIVVTIYVLKKLVISDRPSMGLELSSRVNNIGTITDNTDNLALSDRTIGLELSDHGITLTLSDKNYEG